MKRLLTVTILLSVLLSSCALSQTTPTPSQGEIATQVNNLLTSIPSATAPATAVAAATQTLPAFVTATSGVTATLTPVHTQPPAPTATSQASPTPKPSATVTLVPTATLGPTSTVPASDPTLKYGNPTWSDTFANGKNWPTGENSFTAIDIKNNTLTLTALTGTDGWRLSWPKLTNFYLELSVKSDNCAGSDHYGIIFRVPDVVAANQGYLYGITCDGSYYLRKWDGTTLTDLVKPTANKAVIVGQNQINRLGVLASGSTLTLYVNGVKLNQVTDSTYTKGAFGLFVGSRTTTQLNMIVTNIRYWDNL